MKIAVYFFYKIFESPSRSFAALSVSFLCGVFYASFVQVLHIEIELYPYVAGGLFVLLYFLWSSTCLRVVIFCVAGFLIGMWRFELYMHNLHDHGLQKYTNQKVSMIGTVSAEPDRRLQNTKYTITVTKVEDKTIKPTKILVTNLRYPKYFYGEQLKIICKIRSPVPIEDFAYDKYLLRYNIVQVCSYAQIQKLSMQNKHVLRHLFFVKDSVAKNIEQIWHEPLASFMAGLLYGYRGGLGSLQELFNTTGVTHIVAISGYNITMISNIIISFTNRLYIRRQKAFLLIVLGIILFVIFAGASASVVRAGVMGIIVLCARQLGRVGQSGIVVLLAANIMTFYNPLILMYDAGFQLSVLATLGLIFLPDVLEKYFVKFPKLFEIRESAVTTCAAIISTLPLTMTQFGRVSLVAPIVNILILWVLPYIMFFGFIAVVIGYFSIPVSVLIGGIAYVGMQYVVNIVTFFSQISYASVTVSISALSMCMMYLSICIYILGIRISNTRKAVYL